jgi:hydroxymethylglutaryl-CoA lyase
LRLLVEAGFRHIDAVSFVSPQHVRQTSDSEVVLESFFSSFPASSASPEIIGIVVNEKGAERALAARGVTTLGYPYSISAYFRRANANMSRSESRELVEQLRKATVAAHRDMVVYISMAFGNPYEEPWGVEIVEDALLWLASVGIGTVSLADTVGTATPEEVGSLYSAVKGCAEGLELGVHLHSRPEGAAEKVMAAYNAGCRRFDSALTGLGGCPFAGDDLVGNIATETVIRVLSENGIDTELGLADLAPAMIQMHEIRDKYSVAG